MMPHVGDDPLDFIQFKTHLDLSVAQVADIVWRQSPKKIAPGLPQINIRPISFEHSKPLPEGHLKFFGGRIMKESDLTDVSVKNAARYLWIDGKVPDWINVLSESLDGERLIVGLWCSSRLMHSREFAERCLRPIPPYNALTSPLFRLP